MTPDALRDVFATVVRTRSCSLCTASLVDEAAWHNGTVLCPARSIVHGAPPRCHVVWCPEARLVLETDPPDVEGGP